MPWGASGCANPAQISVKEHFPVPYELFLPSPVSQSCKNSPMTQQPVPNIARVDDVGRREPHPTADEAETLHGFLTFLRDTIAWKSSNLTDAQLHARPLTSTMSIGGLLNHLAFVEEYWFSCVLHGNALAYPWDGVNWQETPDWEWDTSLT